MRRLTLTAMLATAAAVPALAQDDYDLANALADRGWFDMAGELFLTIQNSAALPPEKRAEGAYGLARLKSMEAEREQDPEKKAKLFDGAIETIREFINKYPNHARRNEAFADIGELYAQKGKHLMARSKIDAGASEKAEEAFKQAESLFNELITNLKSRKPERPELVEGKKPPGYDEKMAAFEDWEQRMMFAKFNYGVSLFSHAETYRDNPSSHPDMKRLLEQMVKFFEDDFMWDFENYIKAYEAFIYMGRAYQLLAETGDPGKAEDYWKKCFNFVGKAKALAADPKNRAHEGIRWVAMQSCFYEIKARLAYGDTAKGGKANRQYIDAAKLAEELFKYYPNARAEDMGRIIRIEQARAYCKAGQMDKGVKLLNELKKEGKDTPIENLAIDILGEFVGETNVLAAIEAADNYSERGTAFLYGAIERYRKALSSIRRREDEQHIPKCWYKMAECYYELNRYPEAVAACTMLEKAQFQGSSYGAKGALLKLQCLQKISRLTGSQPDKDAQNTFLQWATSVYPKEIGTSALRAAAIDKENEGRRNSEAKKYTKEFFDAAEQWDKIARDQASPLYGEAIFTAGFDFYRHAREVGRGVKPDGDWTQVVKFYTTALERFAKYLDWYERQTEKDKSKVQYAVGAIQLSVHILLQPKVNKPEQALKVSDNLDKRFPTGDPLNIMKIFAMRLDAKLDMGKIEEAEEDFRAIKARYEKEGLGLESYVKALGLMAQAFETLADKVKTTDKAASDAYSLKSGNYYYEYFQKSSAPTKPDQMEAVAHKFFIVAEQKMEQFQKTGDKQSELEARNFYERARDLFQQFKTMPGVKLRSDQEADIQRRLTRCYLQTGKFEEAVRVYEELTGKDPERNLLWAWEDKADCYMFQARTLSPSQQRNDLIKKADEIYSDFATRLMQLQIRNEHFWRLMYRHAEAMFEVEIEKLSTFFKVMDARQYAPAWDEGKWGFQVKFEDLRKKMSDKMEKR